MRQMQNDQGNYSIAADRRVCWLFLAAMIALVAATAVFSPVNGPDDAMRWIMIQDLLQGQGWFDPYQHRMGPGAGTLMHWSRLVDAPIAAIYGLSDLILPSDVALLVTAFLWPSLLAGLTLWSFAVIGGALGRRPGAISALVIGVIAIEYSRKFDRFSFDHHGLQILLFVAAVMFFVQRAQWPRAGFYLGACLALSMTIGAESMAQIATIGIFVASDWVRNGAKRRRFATGFSVGLLATLLIAIAATASSQSFFYSACDALTLSVALPSGLAALGFVGVTRFASHQPMSARLVSVLVLGGAVIAATYVFAPHCLGNPVSRMPPEMLEFWLSQITEAHGVTEAFQRRPGRVVSILVITSVTLMGAFVLLRHSDRKMEYALFVSLIAVALILFLFQIRMMTFLTLSLVPVQAQMLRVMYHKYRSEKSVLFGILVALFVPLTSPKTGESIEKHLSPRAANQGGTAALAEENAEGLSSCYDTQAYDVLAGFETGMVMIEFDYATNVLRHTDHSVLAGNYHRNEAGLLAQIDLFRSEPSDIEPRLKALGIDTIMICKSNPRTEYWRSASAEGGLPAGLLNDPLPDFLEEIETENAQTFRIFRVR